MSATQQLLLAGGAPVLPPIPGVVVWFKADSITGLVLNDPVSQWDDSSGNSRHATGTLTVRPLYITNQANGLPIVRFDGVNDRLTLPSIPAQAAMTYFLVAKSAVTTSGNLLHVNSAGGQRIQQLTATVPRWETSLIGPVFDVDNVSTSAFQIIRDTQLTSATFAWTFGSGTTGTAWAGDVAELIIYNSILSLADRTSVLNYLAAKYGLDARIESLNPDQVAGLDVWLKANAITGKVNNDPMSTWLDSGLGAKDAAQATGTKQPLYIENQVNGLPIVRFDGVNDWMQLPSMTARTDHAIIFVVKNLSSTADDAFLVFNSGSTQGVLSGYTDGVWTSLNSTQTAFDTVSTSAFKIFAERLGVSSAFGWILGAANVIDSNAWGGDVAELIGYASKISTPVRDQVIRGLKTKYAL